KGGARVCVLGGRVCEGVCVGCRVCEGVCVWRGSREQVGRWVGLEMGETGVMPCGRLRHLLEEVALS
ncbi:hypothetical protein J4Q44_G00130470, partial [Coregonus suidteri]